MHSYIANYMSILIYGSIQVQLCQYIMAANSGTCKMIHRVKSNHLNCFESKLFVYIYSESFFTSMCAARVMIDPTSDIHC